MDRERDEKGAGEVGEPAPRPSGCAPPMRALLFALVAAGSLELYYGATAADTIGGLNWFATVLALGTGGFGLVLAALLAFRRALRATALVLALLLHAALIAGALAVLATREFHAGYGP